MATKLALAFSLLISSLLIAEEITGKNWLAKIDGETSIHELHLPGTHNTAALLEPLPGTAQCQSLTIQQQLEAGVRFLDIRCRHVSDRFELYHGPISQEQNFSEFHQTLEDFLTNNPTECVLVSIQETANANLNTRTFTQTFASYQTQKPKLWHLKTTLPQLSEVRGKAILVRRFKSPKPLGIDATNWRSKDLHVSPLLLIQDKFKIKDLADKWQAINKLWNATPRHKKRLALNFTSGYQPNKIGIPNITTVSNFINPRLKESLSTQPAPPPGILILDFIDAELSSDIYQLNFANP